MAEITANPHWTVIKVSQPNSAEILLGCPVHAARWAPRYLEQWSGYPGAKGKRVREDR